MCIAGNVAAKDREDQSVVAKDQEDRSVAAKDWEDQSVVAKDRYIEVLLQKDQVIMCCKRWRHWRVIVTITDDCWKLPMTYISITLMLLKMLSLVTLIVDDDVVSRIPFSLRGVLKYCNFKGYSKYILMMCPKGDVIIPSSICYYCILSS